MSGQRTATRATPPEPGTPRERLTTLDTLVDDLSRRGQRTLVQAWGRDGPTDWTFETVGEQARRLARGLRQRIEPGQPVGLMADDRPQWIVAALAILRAGGVAMPLDAQIDGDTLAGILRDSGARWVFTDEARRSRVHDAGEGLHTALLDLDSGPDGWASLAADAGNGLPQAEPDDVATMFYTSGTTGPPKGVPLTHANLIPQLHILGSAQVVREGDRVLLPLPLHHVYPFVIGMLAPVSLGLPLVLPQALTGPQVLRAVREGRASVIIGVPRLYAALADGITARAEQSGRIAGTLFRGGLAASRFARRRFGLRLGKTLLYPLHRQVGMQLRVLASGGAALEPELAWTLEALGWQVATGYGLTETAPLLTMDPPGRPRIGSVGRAVDEVRLRIDPEPVPRERADAGEGEILVRGPNVFAGYRNRPEQSREAFTPDGWYRTGDLGRMDDDGYLYVTGRVSTLIVMPGGENIQPDLLEEHYARHPVIQEIGVLQREGQLVGLVVPASGARGGDAEQRVREAVSAVGRGLPSYQRLGDFALSRSPLPRTRLGKIRRGELESAYRQAREGAGRVRAEPLAPDEMSAEDRTLLEQPAARTAWDYLAARYPRQGLTPDTSLQLELGVDSMEWLNLTLELGQRSGTELDEDAVARIDTVRDLLREVAEAAGSGGAAPAALLEDPDAVLGPAQKRWLEPPGTALRIAGRGMHALNRLAMRGLFRVRPLETALPPSRNPVVLVVTHASYLDPLALAAALPYERLRALYWVGWTGVMFTGPASRLFSRMVQVVPMDPVRGVRSGLALAAAVLKRRQGLIWFPEGQRSPDGRLQPFRPGIGLLLERYPVTVVPVSIRGTHEAMPPGRRLPRPGPVELRFGEPLDPRVLAARGAGDTVPARIVDALQARIRALHEGEEPTHGGTGDQK